MKTVSAVIMISILYGLLGTPTAFAYNNFSTESPAALNHHARNLSENEYIEPDLVKRMLKALGSDDPFVRAEAAQVLGESEDLSAVAVLIAALQDESIFVRAYAAEALGRLKDHRALDGLIALLNDQETFVQAYAIEALAEFGDSKAVAPLVAVLDHGDPDVRSHAAWALGNINDRSSVRPLITALKDKTCCAEAAEALRKITRQDFGTDYDVWIKWWENKGGKE